MKVSNRIPGKGFYPVSRGEYWQSLPSKTCSGSFNKFPRTYRKVHCKTLTHLRIILQTTSLLHRLVQCVCLTVLCAWNHRVLTLPPPFLYAYIYVFIIMYTFSGFRQTFSQAMDEVEIFFANFQMLGSFGCQGWVTPKNVKKAKITAPY